MYKFLTEETNITLRQGLEKFYKENMGYLSHNKKEVGFDFLPVQFEQGRKNVGILNDGLGSFSGRDLAGPTRDKRSVQAVVPIGPFASGELGALLAGENDERVSRQILIAADCGENGTDGRVDFADTVTIKRSCQTKI
mgnify:CR=1 FL=1